MERLKVKNIDTVPHSWGGVYISPSDIYTCQTTNEEEYFSNDQIFLQQVAAGKAELYRGATLVQDPQTALQSIQTQLATTQNDGLMSAGDKSSLDNLVTNFDEIAQDAIGNALADSADIDFTYPDALNQITAALTTTGVSAGTYNLLTVNAKGRVTAASNNAGTITRYGYRTSSNNSVTTTTYTTVAQLTSASLPAGLYKFDFEGSMQSAATNNGVGVRLSNTSGTISNLSIKWIIGQSGAGASQSFIYDQTATSDNTTSANAPAANTQFHVSGHGYFRLSVAGAIAIQIRSETSNTAITLLTDAILRVELI